MSLQVSGQSLKTGAPSTPFPQDPQLALVASELNSRYYLNTYLGNRYSAATVAALVATQLFSTAIATFTPIFALYNPLTNKVNLVIDHIWCGLSQSPLATIAQTGAYLLVVGAGQSITNVSSLTIINNATLKAAGSQAVGITAAVLAGAVGNPLVFRPLGGDIALVTATANATGLIGSIAVEDVAGSIIVPPGGYLAIANGVSNAVAGMSTTVGMTWNEIAL